MQTKSEKEEKNPFSLLIPLNRLDTFICTGFLYKYILSYQ